ncbi:hypothetical protein P4647_16910 [Peribacillus frigoritolerans]|uniref:hypothetical protein n=1 Tax=Peribacillus frigoritolerans TaxID=450367 RepID=UPI002E234966|nr:hypothetical protein [Peribacillus frigoritolerans]
MAHFNIKVAVQKFGNFLSSMVMPNISAFIAWGLITALFIPSGFLPNESLAKMVTPAALLFDFNEDEEALKLQTMIKEHGVASALKEVSGLDENSEITEEVINHYNNLK